MISGSVGWLWALCLFAAAFVGVILSIMLVKAGSVLGEKEEEACFERPTQAREQASVPSPPQAPLSPAGGVTPPVTSTPTLPPGTTPVAPPGSAPGQSSGSNSGFKPGP